MNRRDLIKYTAVLTGSAVCTPLLSAILSGCTSEGVKNNSGDNLNFFSNEDFKLVKTLVDVVLPRTDSPSASEVSVHKIIDTLVGTAYRSKELESYKTRFASFVKYLKKNDFESTGVDQKLEILKSLSSSNDSSLDDAKSGFLEFKQQTVALYLSTEKIAKTYLNYLPVPGKYEACITLEEVGNKAWAL